MARELRYGVDGDGWKIAEPVLSEAEVGQMLGMSRRWVGKWTEQIIPTGTRAKGNNAPASPTRVDIKIPRARPFYEAEAKKRQKEEGRKGGAKGGRGHKKPLSSKDDKGLPPRKAGDRGLASTAVGKRFNVSATSVDRARENMMEWGTSAEVEHETVRATVEAYAKGEIQLPLPDPKTDPTHLRQLTVRTTRRRVFPGRAGTGGLSSRLDTSCPV